MEEKMSSSKNSVAFALTLENLKVSFVLHNHPGDEAIGCFN